MVHKEVIGEYKRIHFLVISRKIKKMWHFEILTWKSMGNYKRWFIVKMAERGETDETLGLVVIYTVLCRVLFMSDSLSSVSGHSVHFAKCLMSTFSKGCCSLSFNFNQTLEKVCNLGKYRSFIFREFLQNLKYIALWREVTSAILPLSIKLY